MNNIVEKIKQSFSSNFGKLAGLIIGLSFIFTLILSVLSKNRIDVSLLRAIVSSLITAAILYGIGIVLRKYLGDIIDEVPVSVNNDIDYGAIDENVSEPSSIGENNNTEDLASIVKSDEPINTDILQEPVSQSDKKNKINHDSGGDIGDIIFGKPSVSSSAYTSSSSMFPDKKVNESDLEKEVREDPEKVAKAVRTMIAKDNKEE